MESDRFACQGGKIVARPSLPPEGCCRSEGVQFRSENGSMTRPSMALFQLPEIGLLFWSAAWPA